MNPTSLAVLLSTLLAGSTIGQCFAVTTLVSGDNGQSGVMFNIVNTSPGAITVVGFDECFYTAGTTNMSILTKPGTWVGFDSNPAAWTLAGYAPLVPHGMGPALDPIPVAISVTIGPGATQAFYITDDGAATVMYSTGVNQLGAVIGSDFSLQVTAGVGVAYPFAGSYGLPTAGRLWNGRVHYCLGPAGTELATNTTVGQGCVRAFGSFYEFFPTPASLDLAGHCVTMLPDGAGGWNVANTGSYRPVGSVATPVVLALGDDAEVVRTFTVGSFPGASGFTICSNGYVSVATGNGTAFSPNVAAFLNAPRTAWRSWHDYNPSLAGSGQVKYEESASAIVITWDGVWDFGGTSAANANHMQMQFLPSGAVTMAWGAMSGLGNGHLVGYSPALNSNDPGNTDLTSLGASPIHVRATDVAPLALTATSRPILNTNWNLMTSQIPLAQVLGVDVFGVGDPGILDLASFGMPGCQLRASLDEIRGPWLYGGPTHTYSFFIPNNQSILGMHLFTQSVVFQVPPVNAFGAILSNGVMGNVGDF